MNVSDFESKKIIKICSKTRQIRSFKIQLSGKEVSGPPSKRLATPRVASRFAACNSPSPPPKKGPPMASHTHGLHVLLRNIFEEMSS